MHTNGDTAHQGTKPEDTKESTTKGNPPKKDNGAKNDGDHKAKGKGATNDFRANAAIWNKRQREEDAKKNAKAAKLRRDWRSHA